MGKIAVEQVRCKGCGRCIVACPKNLIEFSSELNERGYSYVVFTGEQEDCHGVAPFARWSAPIRASRCGTTRIGRPSSTPPASPSA